MDLDKLLASLQAAGAPSAGGPLLETDIFVPPDSDDPDVDKDAARRILASFVHWLVRYDRIAPDVGVDRGTTLKSIASRPGADVIEALGDRLLGSDVEAAWKAFATEYLAPVEGGLGDDYFKLFVEAPGRRTLRDAWPGRLPRRSRQRGAPTACGSDRRVATGATGRLSARSDARRG